MLEFDSDRIYAECGNPGGFFALPVGEVWVRTTEWCSNVMSTDTVYGSDLNDLVSRYENILEIVFRSPSGTEILYRAY